MKKRIPDMTAQEVTRRLEELRLSFWAEVKFWHKQAMEKLDNHEQIRLQMGIGEENYQKLQAQFGEEKLQTLLGLLDELKAIKR